MRRTQITIRLLGNDRLQGLVFQELLSSLQTQTNKNPDSNTGLSISVRITTPASVSNKSSNGSTGTITGV